MGPGLAGRLRLHPTPSPWRHLTTGTIASAHIS